MLKANFLTMLLMKPNYEKPIDTAQDILDSGSTVIVQVWGEVLVKKLLGNLPLETYSTKLAERSVVPVPWWDEYPDGSNGHEGMIEDAMVNGLSVVEIERLSANQTEYGKWHRSRDVKGGIFPFGSYMMNKKWTLQEEFNNHILRFQQVTLRYNYFIVHFMYILTFQAGMVAIEFPLNFQFPYQEEDQDKEPEPLGMEYFYFPLGLWLAGVVVSLICLLAEINYCN